MRVFRLEDDLPDGLALECLLSGIAAAEAVLPELEYIDRVDHEQLLFTGVAQVDLLGGDDIQPLVASVKPGDHLVGHIELEFVALQQDAAVDLVSCLSAGFPGLDMEGGIHPAGLGISLGGLLKEILGLVPGLRPDWSLRGGGS